MSIESGNLENFPPRTGAESNSGTIQLFGEDLIHQKWRARQDRYRSRNREKILQRNRDWRIKNKNNPKYIQSKKESGSRRRALNRDKTRQYLKEYHVKNRADRLKKAKEYRLENREKLIKRNRAYYWKNRESILEIQLQRRIRTRKERSEYTKQWGKRNPEKRRAANSRNSARRRGAVGEPKRVADWLTGLKNKKRLNCYWCGGFIFRKKFHIDHISPVSKGGRHELENLCISCPACNLKKSAKPQHLFSKTLNQPLLNI